MENTPYFSTNHLQGENNIDKDDFWQISEPLPKVIFPSDDQIITVENSGNKEYLSQQMPNTVVSNLEGEILHKNSKTLVYTRRKPHKSTTVLSIPPATSQIQNLSDGFEETLVKSV